MTTERADPGGAAAIAVLAVLATAVVGLVVWLALAPTGDGVIEPAPRPQTPNAAPIDDRDGPANRADQKPPTPDSAGAPSRDVAALDPRWANADAPQGVSGRLLRPDGSPAASVEVELVTTTFAGETTVAATATAANGTFALGIAAAGKPVRLEARSPDLPPLWAGPFRPPADTWLDTGDLRFEAGVAVHGKVIDRATGASLAGAEVTMRAHVPHRTSKAAATPTSTRTTDTTGMARFGAVRSRAEYDFTVTAPGFARATHGPHRMPGAGTATLTFELERGAHLHGIVTDPNGRPVGGVELELEPASPPGEAATRPATTVRVSSTSDGTFALDTLRAGSYRLTASGGGYRTTAPTTVRAGPEPVAVRVVPEPWIRLRVLRADGQPQHRFHLALRNIAGGTLTHALRIAGFEPRTIGPADHGDDGWVALRGLPAGRFRCAIDAADHAPAVSEPFAVVPGTTAAAAAITVRLERGGSCSGTVVDSTGRPVPGAVVQALLTRPQPELPASVPSVPARRTRTDAAGRFRLAHLPLGGYQVVLRHPDRSQAQRLVDLAAERPDTALGDVVLPRGTVISGRITVDGKTASRVRVVLTGRSNSGRSGVPEAAAKPRSFVTTAFSRTDGSYELPRRVPPGEYRMHVQRLNGSSNPDRALFDIRDSERSITISPGRDRQIFDFQLPAR